MYVRAVQFLCTDLFARGSLNKRRAIQEDRAIALHDGRLVAHGRNVRAASRAGTHHHGDLRNALARHARLVVESSSKVFAVGKDIRLQGQEAATRVNQVNARQAILLGDLLHLWFHGQYALASKVINTEYRSLTGEAREQAQLIRDQYEAEFRNVIAQGMTQGIFEAQDAKLAAIALIEMGRGISHWYRPDGPLSLTQLAYMHVDWALALVRATRDGKPIRVGDLELGEPGKLYLVE